MLYLYKKTKKRESYSLIYLCRQKFKSPQCILSRRDFTEQMQQLFKNSYYHRYSGKLDFQN